MSCKALRLLMTLPTGASAVDCRNEGLSQASLCFFDKRSKRRFFVDGLYVLNLTVAFSVSLNHAGNQTAVGQTILTGTSVDTGNPQSTELTLALLAVTVGILTSLDDRLLGNPEHTRTCTVVTFGEFQNLLVTLARHYTTLNTSHSLDPQP